MKKQKMHIHYDKESDILEIYFGKVQDGYFRELNKKCFERIDKKTGKVVGYSIFNFKNRKETFVELDLPIPRYLLV